MATRREEGFQGQGRSSLSLLVPKIGSPKRMYVSPAKTKFCSFKYRTTSTWTVHMTPNLSSSQKPSLLSLRIIRLATMPSVRVPSKVMAGITMRGTAPTFYKIEVTTALVTAVAGSVYPIDYCLCAHT
ncbi:hypothetical protein BDR05DRAFT_207280 [Suillus weaverae]|nr:hypothetical protein BDR05DRAFT_207280 [Suillus weaverae]